MKISGEKIATSVLASLSVPVSMQCVSGTINLSVWNDNVHLVYQGKFCLCAKGGVTKYHTKGAK